MIKHKYVVGGWKEGEMIFCLVTAYTKFDAVESFRQATGLSPYTIALYGQAHKDAPIEVRPISETDMDVFPLVKEIRDKLGGRSPIVINDSPDTEEDVEYVKIPCRCKDCVFHQIYVPTRKGAEKKHVCYFWDYNTGDGELPNEVSPDGFCSNGERKSE